MRFKSMSSWIVVLLMLAGIGVVYSFITNPIGFLQRIVIFAIIIGLGFLLYRHLTNKSIPGRSNYINAVKQSKKRYQTHQPSPVRKIVKNNTTIQPKAKVSSIKKPLRNDSDKRKRASHLTVIEGKKGKKKNRAFF
ncbi:hypothetical protein EJF36_13505 [Bacillus sp. HMF5848]|uniref:SA1362 family protein n=1 Tax=Bacillus sp. HMF5848 TaxID=2495421 RepID=UPI000F787968|nr:SA1362 family protein [Bacillus sp. HMF5848]RSK27811.1 hypothetical protein EJF36_13505 [Bacillus sp. HMF5848]